MAETPPAASIERDPPTATVADHRPVPRGVLPRGVQTWVMAGVAVGMLAIMLIVGRPDPPARPARRRRPCRLRAPTAFVTIRTACACSTRKRCEMLNWPRRRRTSSRCQYDDSQPPPPQDPIATDRKRREYESLFASNVVLSRRPENERPDVGRSTSQSNAPAGQMARARRWTKSPMPLSGPRPEPPASPRTRQPSFRSRRHRLCRHHRLRRSSAELRTRRHRSAQRGRCIACSKAPSSTPC